jgi:hypothetical protein
MALVKLVLTIDMVAMVTLLLGTTTVLANLSPTTTTSTMENVLLAIAMLAIEAATPTTHLLPLKVRRTKVVERCTVSLNVRTSSSPHPSYREATLLVVTGSWRRRTWQS